MLTQFVDIHGAAKTKSVPVSGLKAVAEEGAGFAIWGMGMEPHDPDFTRYVLQQQVARLDAQFSQAI